MLIWLPLGKLSTILQTLMASCTRGPGALRHQDRSNTLCGVTLLCGLATAYWMCSLFIPTISWCICEDAKHHDFGNSDVNLFVASLQQKLWPLFVLVSMTHRQNDD